MDQKYLAEIKARADAATPGPWYAKQIGEYVGFNTPYYGFATRMAELNDFEFACHARTDIPALVAEVERLQNENKHLKEELREWENMTPEEVGEMLSGM
ncbi:hypothetical protein [Faecalispora jeddahensis]|uniref:hypothetical protein n=1 Tax=Faecalispora jeddahensis TaxID=1414721 RepID=UPI0028B22A99|nr:hypothetical protein [Faecalispora jeddahensis]